MSRNLQVAAASVGIGIVVLGLKGAAYWVTGSIALLSDALESIINVAAALAAFLALHISGRPADHNHQYGHHKAEYFSAVLEGVLIVVAAVSILRESYYGFLDPRFPEQPLNGLLLNGAATVINAIWCSVLLRVGKTRRSPALIADGKHLLSDVVTSVAVLVGFVLVPVTGWPQLDPLLAGLVAINILWTGWGLVRESVGGLMDAAPPGDVVARIRDLVSTHAQGALEAHDLRTRHAGRMTFVEFHLVVPGAMTVADAHAICDRIEQALEAEMEDTVITIHVEPEGEAKHTGVVVL